MSIYKAQFLPQWKALKFSNEGIVEEELSHFKVENLPHLIYTHIYECPVSQEKQWSKNIGGDWHATNN